MIVSGSVCAGPWRVYDVENGVTVTSGQGNASHTINGLYGGYKGSVRSTGDFNSPCAAGLSLNNDW